MTKQPSLYADIPKLLEQKPFHFGHSQNELDALNLRLAGYKGMDKRSTADKTKAKAAFRSILIDFDRATPNSLRTMELLGNVEGHEQGRSELLELIAQNEATQRNARQADNASNAQTALPLNADVVTESAEVLRQRSELQFDRIRQEIKMRRETIQPVRPSVMLDVHVLRGIDPHLYVPFARAFAASVQKDRAHPDNKHALRRLKNINALGSEVQAFLIMYDYADSIEKFRQKFIRKAKEAGKSEGDYWSEHCAEVMPYLKDITKKYDAKLKEYEKNLATGGKEGYSTLPAYEEWLRAEERLKDPNLLFVSLQFPRDAMKHLAMEYFVGGVEVKHPERYRDWQRGRPANLPKGEVVETEERHKFLSRIENAYQDDLALVKDMEAAHDPARAAAIDRNRHMPTTTLFHNPFDANLHTLCRVYEGRWGGLADEVREQSRTKLLSDPTIDPGALEAIEHQQKEAAAKKTAREVEKTAKVAREAAEAQEKAARAAQRAADRAAREAAKQADRDARAAQREATKRAKEAAAAEAALDSHVGQVMARRRTAKVQRENARGEKKPIDLSMFVIDGGASHPRNWVDEDAQRKKDKSKGGGGRGGAKH